ncbi:radical SAM protein [Pseudescherichia sp.]|uniref:radical SAM protein n=1 Tax=Pseudescherichia sp. TaxID=2055881 RepID=UPI0028986359|nr:radical SAM protein [Pseudescherichia sp.]
MHTSPPLSASLYLTNFCQLQCGHCFYVDAGCLNKNMLSLQEIKRVIDSFRKNKILMLIISGGDPMLHPAFNEIIQYIIDSKMVPLIGITGLDTNPEKLQKLLASGIKNLQVSIDDIKCTHLPTPPERLVGGIIDKNIKYYLSLGFLITVAICVFHENVHNVITLIDYYLKSDVEKIKIYFWVTTIKGKARGYNEVTQQEKELLLSKISGYAKTGKIVIPGYEINNGGYEEIHLSDKKVVVMADKTICFNEYSAPIGRLDIDNPIDIYISKRNQYALTRIQFIEKFLIDKYRIDNVWIAAREQIHCSGSIFISGKSSTIIIANDLSLSCRLLVLAHEIGHKALGAVSVCPQERVQPQTERDINIWALNTLKPYITTYFYNEALTAAMSGIESDLFRLFDKKLANNLL